MSEVLTKAQICTYKSLTMCENCSSNHLCRDYIVPNSIECKSQRQFSDKFQRKFGVKKKRKNSKRVTYSYKHMPRCRRCGMKNVCMNYVQPKSLRCLDNLESLGRRNAKIRKWKAKQYQKNYAY